MYNPYFPVSDALLALWCKNFKEKILIQGLILNMSPTEIADEVAWCSKIIDKIDEVESLKTQLSSAFKAKDLTITNEGGDLKKGIANHKTNPAYTQAIGEDLGIIGSSIEFNALTFKPELFLELYGNNIRIRFKKLGSDGINLYVRNKGETVWKLVSRANKSPYLYHPVLAQPSTPVHFEFRAYGVLNDAEIGIASDIYEILFGE
ncbi:hypothetical protein [Flavobacterium sp.]